ncbi:MAG: sel1 repeat family protein [Bacteroides sp.]|nr:sel1 repeat family protein [Bacteroides sp.]
MKELIKQAKQGDAEAQFLLGLTYYNGDVLENSPEKAFRWWMKATKQEYIFAMPYLVYCYEQGYGTKVDKKKAFVYCKKAAEHGDVDVQTHLARTYYDCFVIEETEANKEKILKWARMGAKLGNVDAQLKLGVIYYKGEVVEQNYDLAMYWLKKAYEEGKTEAFEYIKEICKAMRGE